MPEGGPANAQLSLRSAEPHSGLVHNEPSGMSVLLSLATPELAADPLIEVGLAPARPPLVRPEPTPELMAFEGRAGRQPKPIQRLRPAATLLPLILTVQACLSLPLVWSNTAFTDEALYLRSGHLEIEHWLFSTPIPAFPTYFSGAPVIYPPLAALADSIGGLAGARILSLLFMLAASSLLWATAKRLFGWRTAFFATALFAVLGPALRLGAFATYDAMALCLIACAAWCAVRASEHARASGWLAGAAVSLALANAAKYATGLFDPVVVGMMILPAVTANSWRQALGRGLTLAGYTAGILAFLLTLGGGEYITGVAQTTLARAGSTSPASMVFSMTWQLTGIVVAGSAAGTVMMLLDRKPLPLRLLVVLLVGAALLVPIEQARIHTLTSLDKHVTFGAWFAAIAAGYAVDAVISRSRFKVLEWTTTAVALVLLVPAAQLGAAQARAIFGTWPNSTALVATLRQILPGTSGPILDDNTRAVAGYYLPQAGDEWYRWSNDTSLRLPDGKSLSAPVSETLDPSFYADRVRAGYFSVVILGFSAAATFDHQVLPALAANRHYHLLTSVPYGGHESEVWKYEPQRRFQSELLNPHVSKDESPLGSLLTPPARLKPILGTITDIVTLTGLAVLLFTIVVRLAWRRGKASHEA